MTAQDDRCATCHRSAHRPGMEDYGVHGHAYKAPSAVTRLQDEQAAIDRTAPDAAERHHDISRQLGAIFVGRQIGADLNVPRRSR